jgi:hypothetical protein
MTMMNCSHKLCWCRRRMHPDNNMVVLCLDVNKCWSLATFMPLTNLENLYNDWFSHKKYKMEPETFCIILNVVCAHDFYFVQCKDMCGHLGLFSIQKCTITLQMPTYEIATNTTDEYWHLIKTTTTTKCLKHIVKAICEIF